MLEVLHDLNSLVFLNLPPPGALSAKAEQTNEEIINFLQSDSDLFNHGLGSSSVAMSSAHCSKVEVSSCALCCTSGVPND